MHFFSKYAAYIPRTQRAATQRRAAPHPKWRRQRSASPLPSHQDGGGAGRSRERPRKLGGAGGRGRAASAGRARPSRRGHHNRAALRGQVRGGGARRGRPGARWGPPGCGRPGPAWRRCPEACGLTEPEGSAAWGGAKSAPNQPLAPGQRPSERGSLGWSCSSLRPGLGELGRPRLCPPAAGQAPSVRRGGRGANGGRQGELSLLCSSRSELRRIKIVRLLLYALLYF